jgi:hypothetical protein
MVEFEIAAARGGIARNGKRRLAARTAFRETDA